MENTPYFVDVDDKKVLKAFESKSERHQTYGPAMMIGPEADLYQIAKATKAFLTADIRAAAPADRLAMATGIVLRYEIVEMVEAQEMRRISDDFFALLEQTFSIQKMYRKYPVQLLQQRQLFSTIVDIILETEEGLVLIQHSSFSGKSQKQMIVKARELRAWLHLSKMAAQAIFQKQKVRTYVHFVMDSSLVEVETKMASQLAIPL